MANFEYAAPLTEAFLLSVLGSGLGLLVSATALPALLSAAPATIGSRHCCGWLP